MAILHDSQGNTLNTLLPSNLIQQSNPAVNTGATITLPAVAGQFHYITLIRISRNATAALAGTAQLQITTTNLYGLTIEVGNAMSAGGTQTDAILNMPGGNPLKSQVVNTATTIVLPAPGAAVRWSVEVFYYAAP